MPIDTKDCFLDTSKTGSWPNVSVFFALVAESAGKSYTVSNFLYSLGTKWIGHFFVAAKSN